MTPQSLGTVVSCALTAYLLHRAYPLLPALFGVHISAMALATFGLPTLALQLVRKSKAQESNASRKLLVQLHAGLQIANSCLFFTGAAAIFQMKEEKGLPHLGTNHGKLGAFALALSGANVLVAFRKTVPSLKHCASPKWLWGDWLHRLLGIAAYLASAGAAALAIYGSKWGTGVLGSPTATAVIGVGAVAIALSLVPVAKTTKKAE